MSDTGVQVGLPHDLAGTMYLSHMLDDILSALPVREGHFRLESGYHADVWFTLDALFAEPHEVAPLVSALATRLANYRPTAICGPLLGGAFLAQALAIELGTQFLYSQPHANSTSAELFAASYVLPPELQKRARGQRVALVDDVISAGSSVRATAATLGETGASIVAVGTLVLLGSKAAGHFAGLGVPIEALARREFTTWAPSDCPQCKVGKALENPTPG
jgi:orotate phosphoribosyltransferase